MTDEEKIKFAQHILNYIKDTKIPKYKHVGELQKRIGMNGFMPAEIGHPVFEFKDRYIIYLDGKNGSLELPYYKETLFPFIKFSDSAKNV